MSKVHQYFIDNIHPNYYKKGFYPEDYFKTLEAHYLIEILADEKKLKLFMQTTGYSGEISKEGYLNYKLGKESDTKEDNSNFNFPMKKVFVTLLMCVPVSIFLIMLELGFIHVIIFPILLGYSIYKYFKYKEKIEFGCIIFGMLALICIFYIVSDLLEIFKSY